ncbi:MAG: 2-amino-4-hydroxy-6-hydroxymethyldihydropteridine diphosphokinase [Planctomyces sp.]|nr:2-amino-4-hydroxy-6-hydroxymethyldihydropteridine diphosphokinase [Planctomyces sp.]
MKPCLIAFGGNLGDTDDILKRSQEELTRRGIQILESSDCLRTTPVGENAGGVFVNAAARAVTDFNPHQTLRILHEVEALFGRTREIHWGPRSLDLDLILFDQTQLEEPQIRVPHPAMWYRRFVLQPAQQVAGDMFHPGFARTVCELLERMDRRPLVMEYEAAAIEPDLMEAIVRELPSIHPSAAGIKFRLSSGGAESDCGNSDEVFATFVCGDRSRDRLCLRGEQRFEFVISSTETDDAKRRVILDFVLAVLG